MQLANLTWHRIALAPAVSFDYQRIRLLAENSEIVCNDMKTGRTNLWLLWLIPSLLLISSGCHRYLVATPNLLQHQDPQHVYEACASDCRTTEAAVLYATDRTKTENRDKTPTYGHGRASTLAFGVASVSLNPLPSWTELIEDSTNAKRSRQYELKLASVREDGHFKPLVDPAFVVKAGPRVPKDAAHQPLPEVDPFHVLLSNRLAQATHKDVYIFIHGFNNSFEDAVFRAAEVWHFMGRVGVPIAYTWPAGLGGVRGYAYDRESGEFTVSHLRQFIKAVADCPGVERVHLVAHSRGTDVAISALRELNLQIRAQGRSTQVELKLENLVLAAPDVDEEVFLQRCVGENLLQAARRTTIYVSEHDKMIEAADWLFASGLRLGALAVKDVSKLIKDGNLNVANRNMLSPLALKGVSIKMGHRLAKLPNVQFIECKVSGRSLTHSYVFTHPAALSDLILVLRDRRDPGAKHGRPLRQPAEGIWELTDDYLAQTK